jgi:hypothetical protein
VARKSRPIEVFTDAPHPKSRRTDLPPIMRLIVSATYAVSAAEIGAYRLFRHHVAKMDRAYADLKLELRAMSPPLPLKRPRRPRRKARFSSAKDLVKALEK